MNFKSINENVSNTLEKEQIRFFFQIEMFEGLNEVSLYTLPFIGCSLICDVSFTRWSL